MNVCTFAEISRNTNIYDTNRVFVVAFFFAGKYSFFKDELDFFSDMLPNRNPTSKIYIWYNDNKNNKA